jgi:hypothetical protein
VTGANAGLPDGLFSNQNPNLGKHFWMVLTWKVLVYFMALWSVLRPSYIFYGHLVYFGFTWYIFSGFGMLSKEKSGNTVRTAVEIICSRVARLLLVQLAQTGKNLVNFGQFSKNYFPRVRLLILTKNGSSYILGDFYTNSPGIDVMAFLT